MKKILFAILIITSSLGYSQTVITEGCENAVVPTGGDNVGSFVGENGVTWYYNRVRSVSGTDIISGSVTLLLRSSDSYITSSAIPNGVTAVSFLINQPFGGFTSDLSTDVSVSLLKASDDSVIETLTKTYVGRGSDSEPNLTFTYNFSNDFDRNDVKIQISNSSASSAGIVSFDDVAYTVNDTYTWTGNVDTNWHDENNWATAIVPASYNGAVIPDVTNQPIISSSNAFIANLTVESDASLDVNNNRTLRVYNSATGDVTYTQTLPSSNWHLVSSPVSGQVYNDAFVSANNLSVNGTNNAIATYATGTDSWSYMQTGGSGTFEVGTGYSVKRNNAGTISFTGVINTDDVSIAVVTGGNGGFNLIGNPFAGFLDVPLFLTSNSESLISEDIWIWNQATGNYEVVNQADDTDLSPAQGFFVRAITGTNLTFNETHIRTSGSTFQKSTKTEVLLSMTDGTNNRFAKMYYLDNTTTGFDNGYDGETFGGIENTIDVFTHLVADNQGKKYQIQSLPNSDFETTIVPVGVKSEAGNEITFTAEAINLQEGLKVFLEDKLTNTITRLDEANAIYKVKLTEDLNGIGRFYLHTKTKASSVLSTADVALENVSVYTTNKSTLKIVGLSQGKASVKLYNMLGKQVFATSFNSAVVKDINLPTLATGIYVVQLETKSGSLNKKITLQ